MFWRLVFKLLRGSSGRLAVAVLALVSGAAVISALMNLDFDVERKLTKEFRTLGANVVVSPANGAAGALDAGAPTLMDESRVAAALAVSSPDATDSPVIAGAPFLYVVVRSGNTAVVVAGAWLDQLAKLDPTWKLEGSWINSRSDASRCLIGRNAALKLDLSVGSRLALQGAHAAASCTVAGVIDAGDNEDNQIFASLTVAQALADLHGRVSVAQISVGGGPKAISTYSAQLAQKLPEYQVRPLRQVADAEGSLLARIRLLIIAMVILILVLTALCVLGTMAALAMERREDVGLMKALGGSIGRVVGIFLAEMGVLGAVGGVVGTILGFGLSYWMGLRVFGTAISPRWEVFPITVSLMIVVALTGALPLRLLGSVKPAAIFRGE
ncbi:MAG: ABC transporter permease [Candidatus Acidiferrales bacterium]